MPSHRTVQAIWNVSNFRLTTNKGAVSDRIITDNRIAPAGMPRDVQALNRMNARLSDPPRTRKQVFEQRRRQYPPDAVVLYPMD